MSERDNLKKAPFDLWSMPRCQATAKHSGQRCKNIAVKGKRVCYLHGARAGAPGGNRNAVKHGFYSAQAKSARKTARELIRAMKEVAEQVKAQSGGPIVFRC